MTIAGYFNIYKFFNTYALLFHIANMKDFFMYTDSSSPVMLLLKRLIACPSVTPDDAGTLDLIKGMLPGFEILELPRGDVRNLFVYKSFSEGPHLCFAGHVDVVPAGEGWESDPYTPIEKEGYLHGRGTQDMKSGVAAEVQALLECEMFPGTLSLLLTSDEEGDAIDGTNYCLPVLKEKGLLPDFAIVAEPTCEERFGDAIKVGRRGSINGVLKIKGRQGHAAYPEKSSNPIDLMAPVLPKMAGTDLDEGDDYFAPSRFVITDIRAGMEVTNVTPGELKMMFNVRNSTNTTKEDVQAFVEKHVEGLEYELSLTQGSFPFVTNRDSKIVHALESSIRHIAGITPVLSTAGGTSDARYIAAYGVEVVELGVVNDRIHAVDERVRVEEVNQLKAVFSELLENFS